MADDIQFPIPSRYSAPDPRSTARRQKAASEFWKNPEHARLLYATERNPDVRRIPLSPPALKVDEFLARAGSKETLNRVPFVMMSVNCFMDSIGAVGEVSVITFTLKDGVVWKESCLVDPNFNPHREGMLEIRELTEKRKLPFPNFVSEVKQFPVLKDCGTTNFKAVISMIERAVSQAAPGASGEGEGSATPKEGKRPMIFAQQREFDNVITALNWLRKSAMRDEFEPIVFPVEALIWELAEQARNDNDPNIFGKTTATVERELYRDMTYFMNEKLACNWHSQVELLSYVDQCAQHRALKTVYFALKRLSECSLYEIVLLKGLHSPLPEVGSKVEDSEEGRLRNLSLEDKEYARRKKKMTKEMLKDSVVNVVRY